MRVGIAGAGGIVPDFLNAAGYIPEMEIVAICGTERSKDKLNQLATRYQIERIYTNYQFMLNDAEVEVIYVAVPNHLHYEFAKLALQNKKHVIMEKPFASCYEEAVELTKLAKDNQLYLFEAISNQYFPNYEKVKDLLPELGDIKIVEMNYSQYSRRYDAFKAGEILPVFNPKMSGGALMDINVYNIHFILGLFGEPVKVQYFANLEKGVDTSGILLLMYPSFQCAAIGAKDCKAPLCINIQGDKGYIHSNSPANTFSDFIHGSNSGGETKYNLHNSRERLYDELKAFTDMYQKKDYEKNCKQLKHSLQVMAILDEARRQAGIEVQTANITKL
ncbi:NAD(P)-dependent oxidoreductase [Anaerocolumna cellulosilytica]|uniref:NAD(P)-dependent oxidoreductase n=1 Tax=Anaerocolumna cellulosilytica TaxID=433286 RepID=A0A6S6RCE2_9FIRM|nr:Gfo/Idh/MocA family oxidoreductase [Anaerocolumna cellulosilytica]MBB5198107.1 putative dehydrogenase [Anaerocolumna cellulosilytica]BCJ96508.1 NAD(P)-dependent oxidoreductase [Anaerocolumna cellulosilytica]